MQGIRQDPRGRCSRLEEQELAIRIHEGDADAREELILRNMPLVGDYVRSLRERTSEDDLVQEGMVGLIAAAQDYDPQNHGGTRFSTYAHSRIRSHILDYLEAQPLVRTTQRSRKAAAGEMPARKTRQARAELVGMIAAYREATTPFESLHEPAGARAFRMADRMAVDPAAAAEDAEERGRMLAALGGLNPVHGHVLMLRHGLIGDGPRTVQQVADALGLSRAWILKIQAAAYASLARKLDIRVAYPKFISPSVSPHRGGPRDAA